MNIRAKTAAKYLSLGVLLLNSCYTPPAPKPDILGKYPTISHKSSAILEGKDEKILEERGKKLNVGIIDDQTQRLPIYSGPEFEFNDIGESQIIKYHARNIDSEVLKKTLEEQLKGNVESISSVKDTNQVLIKIKKGGPGLEKIVRDQIYDVVEFIDVRPPQIMLNVRIVKVFADYTKDMGFFLNALNTRSDGLYPEASINLPGASVRVPERTAAQGLGVQYGLIGEIGRYLIDSKLDHLESQGIADDVARPTLVVSNGKTAEIKLIQELPYKNENLTELGTRIISTDFKAIETSLKVTPTARDDGNIYVNIESTVGSYNPTGVLQIPGITSRSIKDEVYIPHGSTLLIAGMKIEHQLGIEKKDPFFSRIPVLGRLFPRGDDTEKSVQMIYFMVTPEYVDVNKSK